MGALILMIATALFIDFTVFLAPSNLNWPVKWMIVGLVSIGQLISIWSWFHMKPWPKKMKEVYNLLTLSATSIYTVGIWLWTPSTNPPFIKYIALGGLLAIQFLFLLFFALKKVKERADERFYANLAKAATLMFAICIATLLVLAGISANVGSITVNAGIFFIMIGVLVLLFGFVFFLFEKRG